MPPIVLGRLADFGRACLDARRSGRPVTDPRFDWDNFFSHVLPAWQSDPGRAVSDLHEAAGDDLFARFGASQVVAEFDAACREPAYLDLVDGGLRLMRDHGLASGHLTGYEADRLIETHGDLRTSFDRIVDVAVPGNRTARISLGPGEHLMVAKTGPGRMDNEFYIERIDDNTFGAYSLREWNVGDGRFTRSEERDVRPADRIEDVLRDLGEYFRLAPYWAHDELRPYFPDRRDL